jgi:hypothetical protein
MCRVNVKRVSGTTTRLIIEVSVKVVKHFFLCSNVKLLNLIHLFFCMCSNVKVHDHECCRESMTKICVSVCSKLPACWNLVDYVFRFCVKVVKFDTFIFLYVL